MPKRSKTPTKKRASNMSARRVKSVSQSRPVPTKIDVGQNAVAVSKQSRVIAMLQSSGGATIAAMMQETGWQQHSVRGFLAGVVRRKLKLKLQSNKLDGNRVYRIEGGDQLRGSHRKSGQPTA